MTRHDNESRNEYGIKRKIALVNTYHKLVFEPDAIYYGSIGLTGRGIMRDGRRRRTIENAL